MVHAQNLRFAFFLRLPSRTFATKYTNSLSLALSLAILFIALGCAPSLRAQTAQAVDVATATRPAGADRCLFCHAAEVEGFARSAMAHALRRAGKEPDGTVTAHGSSIISHSSPTGFWQTWENAGVKIQYRVDYVIGSGEHASGYLVDIGGHLFQSPVAYYKSRQSYDLAPGYENQPDPDFTRPISEECVLCHSGKALHVSGTLNEYRMPAFSAEGITCERCHGPVEKHLADPRAGTIVNPSKLERAARDSICEQCHLFGVARVANPGKKISDFIPGAPLEDTFTIYRNVMPAGSPAGDFKVISHVEQLALSSCARNSGGHLWCVTCHNPHEKLVKSAEYYRSRCLACHNSSFPASHPAKDSNCLGCHMPQRNAKDGGHTVFTDHRIQRVPDMLVELPPNSGIAAWREPSPKLQERNLGIALIDVGMQRHSAPFVIQGYRNLTGVQGQFATDGALFEWIGEALLIGKQTADAKLAFERALQLEPDSALTQAGAASAYVQEGDDSRAIAHLERAVAIDPLLLPAASTLIGLYEKNGRALDATALAAKIRAAMNEAPDESPAGSQNNESDPQKSSEKVFKNVQVLAGIPSDQLISAMQFMASSLGVECNYCHVEGHFEKDDKKAKRTAREMIKMMEAINADSFSDRREVTCYSCHRGAPTPVSAPILEATTRPNANPDGQRLPVNLPTVDTLLERYIEALGGAVSIQKITSRVEKGTIVAGGKSISVEILEQSPNKWAFVRHFPEGDSVSAFDGRFGWISTPRGHTHEMHPSDMEAARMDADLQFPLHIREAFSELRVEYPETVGEREAYVLIGVRDGHPAAKLYFDEQSGLLSRIVRYSESPLGLNVSQTDYADYRETDGVQVPFRRTLSEPGNTLTIRLQEVRGNIDVDNAIFAKPVEHSAVFAAPVESNKTSKHP